MLCIKRLLAAMLCMGILFASGCSKNPADDDKSEPEASSSADDKDNSAAAMLFDTDVWEAVPFISKELRDKGFSGGEGCQACATIVYDPVDGNTAYFGTDVGGIYKSADGGKTWFPCTFGLEACGANSILIDPNNINRVLLVGCNSGYCISNGLFLTENGENWEYVFKAEKDFAGQIGIHNDYRIQLAWDKSSYDEKIGGSAVAYWSREDYPGGSKAATYNHPAIYKTTDGGKTWSELEGTEDIAGGDIAVDAENGNVIAVSDKGAFLSTDGGKTWTKTLDTPLNCLSTVYTKPGYAWAADTNNVYESSDSGKTWKPVAAFKQTGAVKIQNFVVSPADTSRMAYTWIGQGSFNFKLMISHDGGATWREGSRSGSVGDIMPKNSWQSVQVWHPTDKNTIMANGPYISTDGGLNFQYSKTGFNGICVGGYISCNINDNRLMAIGSQDFNGGYSTDSGYTWTYVNWSGKGWGGFTYGAYILNEKTAVTTDSPGWSEPGELVYTKDGGKTVIRTGNMVNGTRIGYGALGKDNICFMGEWRTDDYCDTWTKMNGCTGVFEHDPETGRLFGFNADNYTIVCSDDDGVTWNKICISGDKVNDIAYNFKTKTLYYTTNSGVYELAIGTDTTGRIINNKLNHASGICVDPENPSIMYLCRSYQGSNYDYESVFRSLDSGKTWTCLNRTYGDGRNGYDGGRNAGTVVFNAATREVFMSCGCRGIWKIDACSPDAGNQSN